MMPDTARRLRVNSGKAVYQTIDGEVVIINLDRGHYYSLTGVGAEVWGFLEAGASCAEIVDGLLVRYDAPRPELESAVGQLVDDLEEAELVAPAGPDAPDAPPRNGDRPFPWDASTGERHPFEAPQLQTYTDMEDLLLLDPIHEVDDSGWPERKQG
jgi:hypothetical protein